MLSSGDVGIIGEWSTGSCEVKSALEGCDVEQEGSQTGDALKDCDLEYGRMRDVSW
jgi:hypothetical protein